MAANDDTDGNFEPACQVRLDALHFPSCGLPYLEDRLTPKLLEPVAALRKPWFDALRARVPSQEGSFIEIRQPEWEPAFQSLYRATPALQDWARGDEYKRMDFAALVAVAFSIITHTQGKFRNYATAQDNVSAMLNSRLSSATIGPYAFLLRAILLRSASASLLNGTVGKHLNRAIKKFDGKLCREHQPEWEGVATLLPELFNDRLRTELAAIGAMPDWTADVVQNGDLKGPYAN